MTTRKRNAPHAAEKEQPAAPSGQAWRRPPPETRANIRRHQMAIRRANAARGNPLAPLLSRLLELGRSVALRQWLALLVLAVAVAGVSQLLTLPQFTVTAAHVQVRGNLRASAEQVYAASELEGTNVFQVQEESAAHRVAHLPGVDSAQIHVRLPADVIIDVAELAPLAIVQTITNTVWIGSDGVEIRQVGEAPKLTLVESSGSVRDARGAVSPEIVQALETIQANRPDLTDIHYGTLEGLYFRAPEGYTVYLGEGGAMDRKLALLEATQRQVAGRDIYPEVIDLRFDGYAMLK